MRRGNLVRRSGQLGPRGRDDAPLPPACRAFRGALESFCPRREFQCLHDEFVRATVQYELGDFSHLALDDCRVSAHRGLAPKHRSRVELRRPGIELHADIRRDHRPENGHILLVVHAKKDEHQRIGFAARRDHHAQQENDSSHDNSSHCPCQMFAIASVAECPISLARLAEEGTGSGAIPILLGYADTGPTSASIKRSGTEKTLRTSVSISASGKPGGARSTRENHLPIVPNVAERTLARTTACISVWMPSTASSGISDTA